MTNVFKKILKRIEVILDRFDLDPYAEDTAERIKNRTRLGYGVESRGARRQKLKPLKDTYRNIRRKNKGSLSKATTPKKSNLTFTGQLLDSLRGFGRRGRIVIEVVDNRDDGESNKAIAGYVKENGRPFLEVSDKELKGLRNDIKRDLIKSLRRK